ncbi:hypothetical protein PIB30_059354 [Stylosanthes scabra]|uniref:Uncharacterized protein n=1 Tax=Stylosanthes scabra TaxID=79078 RepID=A0ABU6VIM8_9FABA|nr:hypothetical protein [Stylosanthes scabra]
MVAAAEAQPRRPSGSTTTLAALLSASPLSSSKICTPLFLYLQALSLSLFPVALLLGKHSYDSVCNRIRTVSWISAGSISPPSTDSSNGVTGVLVIRYCSHFLSSSSSSVTTAIVTTSAAFFFFFPATLGLSSPLSITRLFV